MANDTLYTPRPRIAVVSLYDHHQAELAAITGPNHAAYCRANGYSYFSHFGRLDLSRPASWSKLLLVSRIIPLFDFVLWTDTDTVFTDYGRIEEAIMPYFSGGGRILCHSQPHGEDTCNPNFGVVLFQNTPKTQELIFKIYAQTYQVDYPWWEQQAVISLKKWGMRELDIAPLGSFVTYPNPERPDCFGDRLIFHAYGNVGSKNALCKVAVKKSDVKATDS